MSTRQEGNTVGVLTVDDLAVFRMAAVDVIAATPGFEAVGEAASGEEALGLSETLQPDLVLIDVRMPGMDGIETSRRLTAQQPAVVVVLISLEAAFAFLTEARSSGAATFVRKQDFCPMLLTRLWSLHGQH